MKKVSILTGSLIVGMTSGLFAGGYESNALSTSFMYEEGGEFNAYSEVSYGSRSYDIKGTVYAPTGSAVKDQTSTTISVKYDVTDNITVGFTNYNQGSVQLDYSGAGATLPPTNDASGLPVVDLTIDARVLMAKYNISENIGFIAGVKQTVVKDALANIYQGEAWQTPSNITGGNEIGYVYGAVYTRDDIAMRVELTAETSTDFELATTNTGLAGVGGSATGTTKGSTPDYLNLYFQSGIAADTLVYGSVRTANWSENQLYVYPYSDPTSSFTDSSTYSLGLGRKFTDNFSGSVSLSGEPKGESAGSSLLSLTNGYQGITLGGKYTIDNMSITGGYNYTQLGDKSVTPTGGATGEFTDNTITGLGIRVGFKF